MSLDKLSIRDLFTDNLDLTFLIGAGCSVDPPSCQPEAKKMMEAIIKYTCAEPEIEKILKLKNLRFETLLEIIRDTVDPDLKIIDYYGLCEVPNNHHYFLAQMLRKGHFLITSNFDLLIEHALKLLNTPKRRIVLITRANDFITFRDPLKLRRKSVIYKVHGSIKNIFRPKEDILLKESLAKTLHKIGSNKEKNDIFELEPYKLSLKKAMKDRSLVIMGYSSNNDFDIIPTLKAIEKIRNVIWINHIEDINDKEEILKKKLRSFRFDSSLVDKTDNLDNVDRTLLDISKANNIDWDVYRIDTNTTKLIKKFIDGDLSKHHDKFKISHIDWINNNLNEPDEFKKYIIPQIIYDYHDQCDDALKCFENILRILENSKGPYLQWKSLTLDKMGFICKEQKKYPQIINWFQKISPIFEKLQDRNIKAILLNYIGLIYLNIGRAIAEEALHPSDREHAIWMESLSKHECFDKAFRKFDEAYHIFSDSDDPNDLIGKAESLKNMGRFYHEKGDNKEALERFEKALDIVNKSRFQEKKAEILHNKGLVLQDKLDYPNALDCFKEALAIFAQEKNLEGKMNCLYNIGLHYHRIRNNPKAQEKLGKAILVVRRIGDLQKEALYLKTMGFIYEKEWSLSKAKEKYKEAIEILDQLGNKEEKVNILNRIGSVYQALKDYQEALKYYHKALSIVKVLKRSLVIKADCFQKIGDLHYEEGKLKDALIMFKEALQIDEDTDYLKGKVQRLMSIGKIRLEQKKLGPEKVRKSIDLQDILKKLKKALDFKISESDKANVRRMMGIIEQRKPDYSKARKHYMEALKIFSKLSKPIDEASCLSHIGSIYKTIGNYSEALVYYEDALRIYEQERDLPGVAINHYNIAITYHNQGNLDPAALKHYKKALEVYKNLFFQDLPGQVACQNKIALLYQCQEKYEKALEWYYKPLVIDNKLMKEKKFQKFDILKDGLEGKEEKAKAYYYTALIYHDQGNISDALKGYKEALQLFQQLGYSAEVADCLNCIGFGYHDQRNSSEAFKKFDEALKIYEQEEDEWGIATCLNGKGIIYCAQEDYPEAEKKFYKALKIYDKELDDLWGKAACLNNIGMIHRAQEDYPEAKKKFDEALEIYGEELDDLWGKAVCLNNIGMNYQDQGKNRRANKSIDEAFGLEERLCYKEVKTLKIDGFIFYHGRMLENKEFKEEGMFIRNFREGTHDLSWKIFPESQYA